MRGEDEDVGQIGEGGAVGGDAREPDLVIAIEQAEAERVSTARSSTARGIPFAQYDCERNP